MAMAILVHGGAGPARPDERSADLEEGARRAAQAGYAVLAQGGSALDAVEAAVAALEDDPLFNAGTGSCLTEDGDVEMDASVMEGEQLRAGAVTLIRTVKNPIRLARAVMERTPHLFLAGARAERLADEAGLGRVANDQLITQAARRKWEEATAKARESGGGTVGAVAVDARGHVAAGTSTGGMVRKWKGRIGDTPLIGAGTCADDEAGAASATGHGEAIIRVSLTRAVCERLRAGATPAEAAHGAVSQLARVKGEAGVIAVDPRGRLGAAFNTERMTRAWIDERGEGAAFDRPGPGPG